ncbi:MAG: cytochrome c oxidase assembly factor CtaG [Kurthia sp.]|nr:cytochrome c oxidase assembly factor CtaG [Candidatus Kurthia equi]
MPLSIFGFRAMWSPGLIGVSLFMLVVYFLITVKWRKEIKNNTALTWQQACNFIGFLIVLYIIKGSPINLMSHIMFTMHMVQMAVLLLFAPILLIKGIPNYLWQFVIELPVVKPLFHMLTKPLPALIIFAGLFSVYHIPIIFDYIKLQETVHGLFTFVLFLSAVLMYWPLINTLEGQTKMKGLFKVGYIIASAVLVTPACAMIIFASSPLYATYADGEIWMKAMALCVPADTLTDLKGLSGPELFTNMTSLNDQQLGGVLMKILQEIIFGIILFKVFFDWYQSDKKNADQMTEDALAERERLRENEFRRT